MQHRQLEVLRTLIASPILGRVRWAHQDGDVAADVELSDAEMDFYRENGYAVLPGVVNEDACAHMYGEVLEICEKDPKIGLR